MPQQRGKCHKCGVMTDDVRKFPRQMERAKVWAKILEWEQKFNELTETRDPNSIQICGYHFDLDQFEKRDRRNNLVRHALPTKNPSVDHPFLQLSAVSSLSHIAKREESTKTPFSVEIRQTLSKRETQKPLSVSRLQSPPQQSSLGLPDAKHTETEKPKMGYFVLARVEDKSLLHEIVNTFLEKAVTFTISTNPHTLVTKAESDYDDASSGKHLTVEEKAKLSKHWREQEPTETSRSSRYESSAVPSTSAAQSAPQLRRPYTRKRRIASPPEERCLNAADLLEEETPEPNDTELTPNEDCTPSTSKRPAIAVRNPAREPCLVRIVRSSSTMSNGIQIQPAYLKYMKKNPNDEVICNLRITEAVDWMAKTDTDLAMLMMQEGYIPPTMNCSKCLHPMDAHFHHTRLEWRCMQLKCNGMSTSLLTNTWFNYLQVPLKQILKIIILWSQQYTADDIRLTLGLPIKAVWLIENKIRDTCLRIMNFYEALGGPDCEVQLAIQTIGTKTFSSCNGRSTKTNRQILAGVDLRTKRCFMHVVTPKKPVYQALARWIKPGSIINGVEWKSVPMTDDEINKLNLWNADESRECIVDLFNKLMPTNIGDMMGETFPGYLAEMAVRFNEEDQTLKRVMHWLRYNMQPNVDGAYPNGAPHSLGTASPIDKPISEEERPAFTNEVKVEEPDADES